MFSTSCFHLILNVVSRTLFDDDVIISVRMLFIHSNLIDGLLEKVFVYVSEWRTRFPIDIPAFEHLCVDLMRVRWNLWDSKQWSVCELMAEQTYRRRTFSWSLKSKSLFVQGREQILWSNLHVRILKYYNVIGLWFTCLIF